jgi:excisionase family DNA binding protein
MPSTSSSPRPKTRAASSSMATPASEMPRLLSVDGTANALGLSPKTIRRMIDRGDLPVHRLGRAIRLAEHDVIAYLARTRK